MSWKSLNGIATVVKNIPNLLEVWAGKCEMMKCEMMKCENGTANVKWSSALSAFVVHKEFFL